ncbi:MOSC domain-containing protein [Pendulispora rubella]|uniref:MOSC domain-containing protein n=1 Tax=Pendulispora rubella TaxID=2741070 RepID=A0ABZ2KRU0_9BACT
MLVSSLHVYPIKSAGGLNPPAIKVEKWGPFGDRRWMLVDGDGVLISARQAPRLFVVTAEPESDSLDAPVNPNGILIARGPHAEPLRLVPPSPPYERIPVRLHRDSFEATLAGPHADAWFGSLLGRSDVRLVWMDDPATRRPVDPMYGDPGDRVGFADGFPLLITTLASLRQLNAWIAEDARERGEPQAPVTMQRFRPNVVIADLEEPFAEDHWKRIQIGDVMFRVVKPCTRCIMTTIEPRTLAKGKEPLRTLARHHKWNGGATFGMNITPDQEGVIWVGDVIRVL